MIRQLRCILVVLVFAWLARVAPAQERHTCAMGREYFLYKPARIDPRRTYWLVVGVHGYGGTGRGAGGVAGWARSKRDVIVVGPSFPNNGYQLLREQADAQLIGIFEALRKRYRLHPRMFVGGFSGGAQFAHRFMIKHPQRVAGCAAHSAGSWATGGGWMEPGPAARHVPLVISCGKNDDQKSTPGSPHGRYGWARKFAELLAARRYTFQAKFWPGVGHGYSSGARAMTEACFVVATAIRPALEARLEAAAAHRDAGAYGKAVSAARQALRVRAGRGAFAGIFMARSRERVEAFVAAIEQGAADQATRIVGGDDPLEDRQAALRKLLETYRGVRKAQRGIREALSGLRRPKSPR